jgi:hypothetical protein
VEKTRLTLLLRISHLSNSSPGFLTNHLLSKFQSHFAYFYFDLGAERTTFTFKVTFYKFHFVLKMSDMFNQSDDEYIVAAAEICEAAARPDERAGDELERPVSV